MSVIDKMHLTILKLRKKLNQINRIYRGFKENNNNEQSNKNPQEITHLIFVVHGIAQKLDRKKIFKCCDQYINHILLDIITILFLFFLN
jgi:hypothetical protein